MRFPAIIGVALLGAVTAAPAGAETPVSFPRGARYLTPDGAIRVVGYNDMREMLEALCARFAAEHPDFTFALDLPATRAAPPALAKGTSAFAPMGAEFSEAQLAEHRAATGADPLVFRVAHASLHPRALSGPLAIMVHRSSSLNALTLTEVADIFTGADRGRGLLPCGLDPETALGRFFHDRVLAGESLASEFIGYRQSTDVIERVAEDPGAIGYAAPMRVGPGVKILALAARPGEKPVSLTEENVRAGRYPLDRHLLIAFRSPLERWMRAFIDFVLSGRGQEIIASGSLGYLPLDAGEAAAERAKLERREEAGGI